MAAGFFGYDQRLIFNRGEPDIDTTFAQETNQARVLVMDLYKIITTASGLLWWAPLSTEDVYAARGDAPGPAQRSAFIARLSQAVQGDRRFDSVDMQATWGDRSLSLVVTATAGAQKLTLVMSTAEDGTLQFVEASANGQLL